MKTLEEIPLSENSLEINNKGKEGPFLEPIFRSPHQKNYYAGVCFCICDCGCDKLVVSPGAIVLGSIGYIIDG